MERFSQTDRRPWNDSALILVLIGAISLWMTQPSEPSLSSIDGSMRSVAPEADRVIELDRPDVSTSPPTESEGAGAPPVEAEFGAKPEQRAPDFELPTLNGETRQLHQRGGRPVLINVWATYCPFCEHEMPMLERMDDAHSELTVLGLNVGDNPETIRSFVERVDVDYPILLDRTGEVAATYQVTSLPATFLIDAEGTVRWRREGSVTSAELERQLRTTTSVAPRDGAGTPPISKEEDES